MGGWAGGGAQAAVLPPPPPTSLVTLSGLSGGDESAKPVPLTLSPSVMCAGSSVHLQVASGPKGRPSGYHPPTPPPKSVCAAVTFILPSGHFSEPWGYYKSPHPPPLASRLCTPAPCPVVTPLPPFPSAPCPPGFPCQTPFRQGSDSENGVTRPLVEQSISWRQTSSVGGSMTGSGRTRKAKGKVSRPPSFMRGLFFAAGQCLRPRARAPTHTPIGLGVRPNRSAAPQRPHMKHAAQRSPHIPVTDVHKGHGGWACTRRPSGDLSGWWLTHGGWRAVDLLRLAQNRRELAFTLRQRTCVEVDV